MFDYDLLCIGSGPAGQRAAVQAAKLGKRTAVIERGRFVGGVCVDTGTIPSKTFREAVLTVMGRAGFTDGLGQLALRQRPSAQALMARVAEVEHLQAEIIREQLQRNDVTVLSGGASFQDVHTVVVSRDSRSNAVTAANILLAVGTVPAPPPSISTKPDLVVTSDELLHQMRNAGVTFRLGEAVERLEVVEGPSRRCDPPGVRKTACF